MLAICSETDFAGFFASQRPYLQKKVEDAVNAFSQYPDMIAHMTEGMDTATLPISSYHPW